MSTETVYEELADMFVQEDVLGGPKTPEFLKILDQLETSKVGDGTPPGLDRDALAEARSTGRRAPGVSTSSEVRSPSKATVEAVAL